MRCVSDFKIVVVFILIITALLCLSGSVATISLNSCASAGPSSPKTPPVRAAKNCQGNVTDVRVIRHVESHCDAWRLWKPVIAQWKRRHLAAAFGAMIHGKKDTPRTHIHFHKLGIAP